MLSIPVYESPRLAVMDKLNDGEVITAADVESLDLFNEFYIEKLMRSGQKHIRLKLVEALTIESIRELKVNG